MVVQKLRDISARLSSPRLLQSEHVEQNFANSTSELGNHGLEFAFLRNWAHHPRLIELAAVGMAAAAWSYMAGRQ
jgi:hypothetical protein